MPASLPLLRATRATFAFALAGTIMAQTPLPKSSPFEPPANSAGPANAAGETYDFAGVNTIEKTTLVNIYDKQLKKGKWIAVGATLDGITVKSYDAARDTVVVRVGEQDKVLGLRKSSSTATVAVPGLMTPTQNAAWNVPPPTVAPQATVPLTPVTATPAVASTVPQPPPPAPGTIAHQEQEARMLVSDL